MSPTGCYLILFQFIITFLCAVCKRFLLENLKIVHNSAKQQESFVHIFLTSQCGEAFFVDDAQSMRGIYSRAGEVSGIALFFS